jgi:hypothetical protein
MKQGGLIRFPPRLWGAGLDGVTQMTQAVTDDATNVALDRRPIAGLSQQRLPTAADSQDAGVLREAELDWQENQDRTGADVAGTDFTLVGIAVTLTAVVVAGVIGLVNLL